MIRRGVARRPAILFEIREARMIGKSLLATGFLLFSSASEASMNGRTINGDILDPRIAACGVTIDGNGGVFLRPFIETSHELAGTYRFAIASRSGSNSSVTSQANRFSGGSLGSSVVGIGRASKVSIDLEVTEANGAALCRVKTDIDLDEGAIRL
jgi:hypothetical protein